MLWRGWSKRDQEAEGANSSHVAEIDSPRPPPSPAPLFSLEPQRPTIVPRAERPPVTAPVAPITSPIGRWLKELHAKHQGASHGKLASYIPELTRANPDHFGVALATADGQIYEVGNSEVLFTIQSRMG